MQFNKKAHNIILASQSPRRKELLANLGYHFSQTSKEIDESYPAELNEEDVAEYLSKKKAKAYRQSIAEGDLLITSDTTVCLEGKILGKPENEQQAREMLNNLSGKQHLVISGVCLTSLDKIESFAVTTKVWVKKLSEEEIDHYISVFKPFDKAGGYGIQEWIGYIGVEKIEGSFYNVMGLPVKELYEAIESF